MRRLALLVPILALVSPRLATAGAFEPCASAKSLVAESVRGPVDARWPLYELELAFNETWALEGRMLVSFVAPADGLTSVWFALPSPGAGEGAQPPVRITATEVALGEATLTGVPHSTHGLKIEVPLPQPTVAGQPVRVQLTLKGQLPRLMGGSLQKAMSSFTSGAAPGPLGTFSHRGEGGTLLGPHPVLLLGDVAGSETPDAAEFGAPLPGPLACHLVQITTPRTLDARSSGKIVGRVPQPEGGVRHTIVAGGARRVAVALVPTEMASVQEKVGAVQVQVTAADEAMARRVLDHATHSLKDLEKRWGRYPYPRLEVVLVPMNGLLSGMRGPGVVLLNDLLNQLAGPQFAQLSALSQGRDPTEAILGFAVVHQLAHQWFGEQAATLGPAQPVVEEVLANHAAFDVVRSRLGTSKARDNHKQVLETGYGLWRMMGRGDAPADLPSKELSVTQWLGVTQVKGAGLLPDLEKRLGTPVVLKAMKRWLKDHRDVPGDRASLEKALVRAAGKKHEVMIRERFAHWLDQRHGDTDLGGNEDLANLGALLQGTDPAQLQQLMNMLGTMMGTGP